MQTILLLFCPDITEAQDIIITMNNVCEQVGWTISFKQIEVM